ncbi:MAG: restriction modification system specificity domain protein [Chthonomonadaceae bacterium]|nr:restriction modification system specificity domain protein [Chthonomonadaceae bacterium]
MTAIDISDLPATWNVLSLEELGAWRGGGTPNKAQPAFWTNGTIPWVSPKDMKTFRILDSQDKITTAALKESLATCLQTGAVLVVVRSGILRHSLPIAVAQINVALNQDMKGLECRAGILPDYVAYALMRYEQDILHTCSKAGTTVNSIEFPMFSRFKIPVAPFEEQKRIVAEIEKQFSRLNAAVTALKRVQANLKRYRAAVLLAACEGRLVPTEAELARQESRDYEPADALLQRILCERRARWEAEQLAKLEAQGRLPLNDTWKTKYQVSMPREIPDLPALPEGWCWTPAGNLFNNIRSGSTAVPQNEFTDYPILRSSSVRPRKIVLSDVRYLSKKDAEGTDTYLTAGDLLFTRLSGSVDYVGNCVMIRFQPDKHIFFSDRVFRAQPVHLRYGPYIELYFASPLARQNIEAKAKSTAGHQRISTGDITDMFIPLPPFKEQERIVAEAERRLSIVDEVETTVAADLKRAERLRQAILQRAFSGKLVPQHPTDEPASMLLERIQTEREGKQSIKAPTKQRGAKRAGPEVYNPHLF